MATNLNDIVVLKAGEIIVEQVTSGWGIEIDPSSNIKFGLVYMRNDLCDTVNVNDIVSFNIEDATQLTYNGNGYYLLKENKVSFIEAPAP